jgi:HEPN domain-containing protein
MKQKHELVSGWLRKAESDFSTIDAAVSVGAFDTACFHAQQTAEKALKAFLIHADVEFPFTHNLAKLVNLSASVDNSFASLGDVVEPLTPFAVELRYDAEFWPDKDDALDARQRAESVIKHVRKALGIEH